VGPSPPVGPFQRDRLNRVMNQLIHKLCDVLRPGEAIPSSPRPLPAGARGGCPQELVSGWPVRAAGKAAAQSSEPEGGWAEPLDPRRR